MSAHLRPLICPHCSVLRPLHHDVNNTRPPQDGDVMVCNLCLQLARYVVDRLTGAWLLRKLTPEEDLRHRSHPLVKQCLALLGGL